jgi:hypothetical protein
MKTLNDSLREEFRKELNNPELLKKIELHNLDPQILERAFDVLLKYKTNQDLIEKARSEFENYLINHLRTKSN